FALTGAVNLPSLGLERSGNLAVARAGSIDWIDPVIGMRVRHSISPGKEIQLRGDVGGFGIGSDFSWQLYGGYSHTWKRDGWDLAGVIGYRALAVDFQEGNGRTRKGIDAVIHGPMLGLSFRW
ncbi:MAG: hypothetical protein ACR2OY_04750, partial [Boseongicola sp.]